MQVFEDLVCTARRFAEAGSHQAAYNMLGRALEMKPHRIDLHVDVAELEYEAGDTDAANERLEQLASIYIEQDMLEEAEALIAMMEAHDPTREPGAVVPARTGMTEPMTVILGVPKSVVRAHTQMAQPILLFPDGTPMPIQPPKTSRPGFRVARTRPKPGQARFRVGSPPPAAKPHKVTRPPPVEAMREPKPVPVIEAKPPEPPRKNGQNGQNGKRPPPVPGYMLNVPIAPILRVPKEGTLSSRLKKMRR